MVLRAPAQPNTMSHLEEGWPDGVESPSPAEPRVPQSVKEDQRPGVLPASLPHNRTMPSSSVAEPEPPGAATFRAAPEPELIFFLVGAGSRSRLF